MDDDCQAAYASVCQARAMCAAGKYRVGFMCRPCPSGKYNPTSSTSSSACRNCPAGRFGSVLGQSSSDCSGLCDPGYYCPGGQSAPDDIPCPAGRFGQASGLATSSCSGKCQAGFYCQTGETSATPTGKECGAGKYGNAGATTPSCSGDCEAGYFCPAGSSSRREYECGRNKVDPSAWVQCPNPLNPTTTINCPSSQYCPRGSGEPNTVLPFYATYSGGETTRHSQGSCPRGSWCPNGERRPCAAGRYGLGSNTYTDDQCEGPCTAGYQCPAGSHSPSPFECARNPSTGVLYQYVKDYYCPEGTGASLVIPDDHFSTPRYQFETTRTGSTLCVRDHACIKGYTDLKIEFSTGCASWDSGSVTGDRRWKGDAVFQENSDAETVSISLSIRPPTQAAGVSWSVEAECDRWSSQFSPDPTIDFSTLFEVSVNVATTSSIYSASATATVRIAPGKSLNFEVCEKFSTRLVATINDPSEAIYTVQTFTCRLDMEVQDTNDAPFFPGELGQLLYIRSSPEAVRANTPVGDPIEAADEDVGQEHTYSITSGNDANMFGITRCGGQLFSVNGDLDFETEPVFNLTITVADSAEKIGGALTGTTDVMVVLTNVNERPYFVSEPQDFSIPENMPIGTQLSPGKVNATDPDGDDLVLTIQVIDGNQAVPVFIVPNGSFSLLSNAVLDFEQKDSYRVVVSVFDGEFDAVTDSDVSIIDMNDPPVFIRSLYTFSVLEDTISELAGENITAIDPDAAAAIEMAIVQGNSDSAFRLVGSGASQKLALNTALDYEATGGEYRAELQPDSTVKVYRPLLISASDGENTVTVPVNVTIRNINESPTLATSMVVYVDEELSVGSVVGTALSVSDPEKNFQSFFWSIVSPAGLPFELEPSSGKLRVRSVMDFESVTGPFVCTIRVRDNGAPALADTSELSVFLNDVNESPFFIGTQAFSFPENSLAGTHVGAAAAGDVDANDQGALSFSACELGGSTSTANRWDLFSLLLNGTVVIHSNVSVSNTWQSELNFENSPGYTLCLNVTDSGNGLGSPLSTQQLASISLIDQNEPPRFVQNFFVVGINDGAPAGTTAGSPLRAEDQDAGSVLSFEIIAGNTANFSISSSGQIFATASVPPLSTLFEDLAYTVRVADQTGLSAEASVTVRITNANQAPIVDSITMQQIDEHSPTGTVVCTVTANDPDSHDIVFSLAVDPPEGSGALQIDSTTGVIKISDSLTLDRELVIPYQDWEVTVFARDESSDPNHASLSGNTTFALSVQNINEPPSINTISLTVPENQEGSTGGSVSADDVDSGDTLSFSIFFAPPGFSNTFSIDPISGVISIQPGQSLNFEDIVDPASLVAQVSLSVLVTDSGGLTDTAEVIVDVVDTNEAPILTNTVGFVLEGQLNSPVLPESQVGNLSIGVFDPDLRQLSNGVLQLEVVATHPAAAVGTFRIEGSFESGYGLVVANRLDFEDVSRWIVTARVSDGGLPALFDFANFTIEVGDVDDAELIGQALLLSSSGAALGASATTGGSTLQLQGANLGFTQRRILASGLTPVVQAYFIFNTQNIGIMPNAVVLCSTAPSTDSSLMTVFCSCPPGIGEATVKLRIKSAPENLDCETSNFRLFSYMKPSISSVSFSHSPLNTEGGQVVTITGANFGPDTYTLPAAPVSYMVPAAGSTIRFTESCVATQPHTSIRCTTVPGVGSRLRWIVSLAGKHSSFSNAAITETLGYAPPQLWDLQVDQQYGLLSGKGGDRITLKGENLGNSVVYLVYRSVSSRFRYKTSSCTFMILHREAECLSVGGSGTNHHVEVVVGSDADGWRVSESMPTSLQLSYAKPEIQQGGISGPGSKRADTRGGQIITVLGQNLGAKTPISGLPQCGAPMDPLSAVHTQADPSLAEFLGSEVPILHYGPIDQPMRYMAQNCIVVDDDASVMECCSASGTGHHFVFQVYLDGQTSIVHSDQHAETGFHPPIVQELLPSADAKLSNGGGQIVIRGEYFGSQTSMIDAVVYGQGDANTTYEFEASSCRINPLNPHTEILCLTDEQAGTGLGWSVRIDGQQSELAKTDYAPPIVLSMDRSSGFSARGGELVQLYGKNFGPPGNTTIFFEKATYSGEDHSDAGQLCSVQSHEHIVCMTSPGTGSGLRWEVTVAKQTSARSVQTWSYKPPEIVELYEDGGKPTDGLADVLALATDLAALDQTTTMRVHFKPQKGTPIYRVATAQLAPAPNSTLDSFTVRLASGWGHDSEIFVSLHLMNANKTEVSRSVPFLFNYDAPRLLSIQLEPPSNNNNKYTATLVGINFGASAYFAQDEQPMGFVSVLSDGVPTERSYCPHGTSMLPHCVNLNASSTIHNSSCTCPLKVLDWKHKLIKFETATSRGNVSVSIFKKIGANGKFEYHTTNILKFEASAPSVVEDDRAQLEALWLSTDGGDDVKFRMKPIENQPSLLQIFAGHNQFLPLEEGKSCLVRPCLVKRPSRECTNVRISDCVNSQCTVRCIMPPGQGIVQMVAEYAGKPSVDAAMPRLTYAKPSLNKLRQVAQTDSSIPASTIYSSGGATGSEWEIGVPTSGACCIATGENFGDAKYWAFVGDAPSPYGSLVQGRSSPPKRYLAGLHLLSPARLVNRRNTSESAFCLSAFVQPSASPMKIRLFTGIGFNKSETLDKYAEEIYPNAVDRYASRLFFGKVSESHEFVHVRVQPPTAEPVILTAPTRGNVVLKLVGQNFGAETEDEELIPKVWIGGRECKLVTVVENGVEYKREQLCPSSTDSPHQVITCMVPEGAGLNNVVLLKVGAYEVSNQNGGALSGVTVNYRPPTLLSVLPQRGPTQGGGEMVLLGENFGNSLDHIAVHFVARRRTSLDDTPHFRRAVDSTTSCVGRHCCPNPLSGVLACVSSLTHESLHIAIPPGQGDLKQVVIEVAGQRSITEALTSSPLESNEWPLSSNTSFAYDPPQIRRLERQGTCSTSGCEVTILGENFGTPVEVEKPNGLPDWLNSRYKANSLQTSIIQIVDIDVEPVPRLCITTEYDHDRIVCTLKAGVGQGRNITISLGSHTVTAPIFSYAAPIVTDIVPNVANAAGGRTIRFTGDNFGPLYSNESFDGSIDLIGSISKLTWEPPVNILISNSSCQDARVFASHIEAQCTFGETIVGPAMLAMDVAGVELRQSPQALGGLLQFTCERGFYGQVGEKCAACPVGSICDFNGRYDCTKTSSTLCTGEDCEWFAPLFCKGNSEDCPRELRAGSNGTANQTIEYENRICVQYPEPIADVSFWRDDKDASNVLCDPSRVNRPPPYTGTCPTFLKCEPAEACLGNNTCAEGYTDFRCSKCAKKFYRFDGECRPCPDRAWLPLVMFVCGIMFIGAFGFWLNRKNINLALMSISVDYVQVLGLFARSKIEWPKILKDLFSYMSFFNFNLDLTAPECLAPSIDYRLKWIGTMVLPMAVFFLLLSVYVAGNLYMRYCRRLSKRQRTAHKAPTVGAGLTLSYFMYLYVSRTVLDIFNCSPTDPPDDWEPGYMQADFIPCYKQGGIHLELLPFAFVFLLVYVMAYPALIYAWLRRSRHIVKVDQLLRAYGYGHDEKTSDRLHHQFRRMFHKVYYHFKPDKWYWITVIISRKFLIAITALLFRSTPGYQLAMIVLVLFASYSVHIRSSPFMSRPEHRSITLAHEMRVEESDPYHLQLDASLQPLLQKAQRADRSDFRQATFGAEKKRGADLDDSQLMTNYNTVESVLLVSAILVALSGIMFNSKKMVEMDTSPAKDALTMLVLIIILASVAYFVVIFVVEIVETIGDDPLCCCHCLPPRPRKRLCCVLCGPCQQSYKALRWTHDKYLMSQKRTLGVDELEEMVKGGKGSKKRRGTDSQMNPMAALAMMSSSSRSMSNKDESRAMEILSGSRPPNQTNWLLTQQFLTARRTQVEETLPEEIKVAKRGVRNVDANTFAKSLNTSVLRAKGSGRRQFSQKSRTNSNPQKNKGLAGGKRSVAGIAAKSIRD
mgnify:CR=1 FL=1